MLRVFQKKQTLDLDKFHGLDSRDRLAMRQYADTVERQEKLFKQQNRQKRQEKVEFLFKKMGSGIPKGIKHPDSLVRNGELYGLRKSSSGKKKGARLF